MTVRPAPKISGPWSTAAIEAHLAATRIPLRLASLAPSGTPCVTSLWFLLRGGSLWCATVASARVVNGLRQDPRCGFEIASDQPPYRGVRGQGIARIDAQAGGEVLRELIGRYLGDDRSQLARWLVSRVDREVAIEIIPNRLTSWDYGERMRDCARTTL